MVSGPDLVGASLVGIHADANPGQSPSGWEKYTSLGVGQTWTRKQPQSRMSRMTGSPTPLLTAMCPQAAQPAPGMVGNAQLDQTRTKTRPVVWQWSETGQLGWIRM